MKVVMGGASIRGKWREVIGSVVGQGGGEAVVSSCRASGVVVVVTAVRWLVLPSTGVVVVMVVSVSGCGRRSVGSGVSRGVVGLRVVLAVGSLRRRTRPGRVSIPATDVAPEVWPWHESGAVVRRCVLWAASGSVCSCAKCPDNGGSCSGAGPSGKCPESGRWPPDTV